VKRDEEKLTPPAAGAGTGDTIAGIASYLKAPTASSPPRSPTTRIYLSDPPGSGLYNLVTHGVLHSSLSNEGSRRRMQSDTLIEGIGLTRLTANFKEALPYMDGAVRVSDEGARRMARWLVERDGGCERELRLLRFFVIVGRGDWGGFGRMLR